MLPYVIYIPVATDVSESESESDGRGSSIRVMKVFRPRFGKNDILFSSHDLILVVKG